MYAYFIDDWVYNKHHRKLDRLDLLLTQKGISGRKIKLARLNDLSASIRDCASSGIKTFVSVGNDTTASRVLNSILSIKDKIGEDFSFVFGVVPIGEPNMIAKVFGYQNIQESSESLARHRTEKIDLGLLNGRHYFVTSTIFPRKCSFGFKSYTISSLYSDHHISVCNSNIYNEKKIINTQKFNIRDGILEAVIAHNLPTSFVNKIRGKKANNNYIPESIFPIKVIYIKSKEKTVSVNSDAEKHFTIPIKVEVKQKFLEVVIGNNFYGHTKY